MATWTVEIEVANLQAKQANVTATRTDGVDVREFELARVSVDTHDKPIEQIRAEVGAALWDKYQEDIVERAKIDALLTGWEAALATDLNDMEP